MKIIFFKYCLLVICTFLSIVQTIAQEQESQFQNANELYAKGKIDTAITVYNKILASGYQSADLYYNLGNCYYKTNEIAPAILNYEKAIKLNPSHDDALFNLKFAQNKTIDKITTLPVVFYKTWWRSWLNLLSFDDWAKFSIVSLFVFIAWIVLFISSNSSKAKVVLFTAIIVFFVVTVTTVYTSWASYTHNSNDQYIIVMNTSSYVKSEPNAAATNLFILHEGAKGLLLEQTKEWARVKLADGNEGWIAVADVELI